MKKYSEKISVLSETEPLIESESTDVRTLALNYCTLLRFWKGIKLTAVDQVQYLPVFPIL